MTEQSEAVRRALADAREAIERPLSERPRKKPVMDDDTDPILRTIRATRARHGFARRNRGER